MRQVFGGAVLVIAGIAAFIEAHSYRPMYRCEAVGSGFGGSCTTAGHNLQAGNLGQMPYDLLRIGAWALAVVGGLLVVTGLIRYWAEARR